MDNETTQERYYTVGAVLAEVPVTAGARTIVRIAEAIGQKGEAAISIHKWKVDRASGEMRQSKGVYLTRAVAAQIGPALAALAAPASAT